MPTSKIKKICVAFAVVGLLLMSSPLAIAVVPSASAQVSFPTIIEAGSMVDAASYIVFQDGPNTFAKCGSTGRIELSSADASTVLNAVLGVEDRTVILKPGDYDITASIRMASGTTLIGHGARLHTTVTDLTFISLIGSCDITAEGTPATPIYGTNLIITDTSSIAVGDTVYLRSDDLFVPWVSYAYMASQHTVTRVIDASTLEIADSIYLDYQTNTRLIPVSPVSGVTIEGLTLIGTGPYVGYYPADGQGNTGIRTEFARDLTIRDVTIRDCSIGAIMLHDTTDVVVDSVHIDGSHQKGLGYGVNAMNTAKNIMVSSSIMEDCRHGSSNGGNTAGIPAYITYSQCTFRNTEAERQHSNGLAIGYDACTFDNVGRIAIECSDSFITNSYIQGARYDAPGDPDYNVVGPFEAIIRVGHSQAWPERVKITNNHIKYSFEGADEALYGINLNMAPGCMVSGNTIEYSGDAVDGSAGIRIYPVKAFDDVQITNNIIRGPTTYGVMGAAGQQVTNLTISNNVLDASNNFAISIGNNFATVSIMDNSVNSIGRGGIYMSGVKDAIISGNYIWSSATSTYAGIHLASDCSNVVVTGNNVRSPYVGVFVNGAEAARASLITISDNILISKTGVRCIYTDNATIIGNVITVLDNYRGISLDSNDRDIIVSGNVVNGPYTSYVYVSSNSYRISINGVGTNGANDPASAGYWYGYGYEGLIVTWTDGDGNEIMSCYRGGSWLQWVVT